MRRHIVRDNVRYHTKKRKIQKKFISDIHDEDVNSELRWTWV